MRRSIVAGVLALALLSAPALAAAGPIADGLADVIAERPHRRDIAPVALQCRGGVVEGVGVADCSWRVDSDVPVGSWQLWRLQVRPATDGRVLVAELGGDETEYGERGLPVPSVHRYAVLGFDGAGHLIARSRSEKVVIGERRDRVIDLACEASRGSDDPAAVDHAPTVGCRWSSLDLEALAGYVVYRSVDGGERTVLARTGPDATSIVDDDVSFGHRYGYLVTAVDSSGGPLAHSRVVTVGIPLPDRPSDHPTDRVTDRPTDHPTDRVTDHRSDQALDHPSDVSTDAG